MSDFNIRKDCRLCYSSTKVVFELTPTPPANELVTKEFVSSGKTQDTFPLPVVVCTECGHVQLSAVVDPERLFRHYLYTSGVSSVFVQHFKDFAADTIKNFDLKPSDLVIEIGSNDGTLLKFFKDSGMNVVGVDPAKNIARLAEEKNGVRTIAEFFDEYISDSIQEGFGKAKVIIANNVFAHSDVLDRMATGISSLLDEDGVFIFEVSYLPDFLNGGYFDQIYHEHLSFHHLSPLVSFFQKFGLKLFDAHRIDTQGGSIRGFVGKFHKQTTERFEKLIEEEEKIGLKTYLNSSNEGIIPLIKFNEKVDALKTELRDVLTALKAEGKKIVGFGAPAKCVTLMHHFGFGQDILDFIVDESPLKYGYFTPGKHVEIFPVSSLYEKKSDYCIILVWNFAKNIMERHSQYLKNGGKFIVPIPEIKIYE